MPCRWPRPGLVVFCILALWSLTAAAADVRVGVLPFGTVSWELDVIKRHKLAEREGVNLVVVPLAGRDASTVALQGGAVDVIVSDWLWVARQRSEGRMFVFAPYSRAEGSLMVRADAGIARPADLKGRRLGVAGGALDKSWLLLRAYARRTLGEDAATLVKPDFAAPPLLNQLALKGELPAVLNYWHFAARLEAAGLKRLLSIDDMLDGLGLDRRLPMLGWVFAEKWGGDNRAAAEGFLRASAAAKKIMATSDAEWNAVRPLMNAEDDATFDALRSGFRAGILDGDQTQLEAAARRAFAVLAREGGEQLVGRATELAPGVFWQASAR